MAKAKDFLKFAEGSTRGHGADRRLNEADISAVLSDANDAKRRTVAGQSRTQINNQFIVSGNSFWPSQSVQTVESLPAGIYSVEQAMSGTYFSVHEAKTDELIRFEDPRHKLVLEEIQTFWKQKSKFHEMGLTHKRGMLLTGAPGTGKSCILKLVMEDVVVAGDIVLSVKSPYTLQAGLQALRDIEPNRNILCVLEDTDEFLSYNERTMLELFDGDAQVDGVLYIGTTNYPERFSERMLRPGRFDRKLEIGRLPESARIAYFTKKLGTSESVKSTIKEYSDLTKGFSFAQMREFLVATHCLGHSATVAADRVRTGKIEAHTFDDEQLTESLKVLGGKK